MTDHVTSGPALVLSTGTATTFLGHPLEVSFQLPDDSWYRIDFHFRIDGADDAPSVSSQGEPWGLELHLHNFTDGRGSAVPVLLGQVGEQLFFLHFRVFRHGRTADHTVTWTVFQAAADEVDWRPEGS